jgi:beta-phosphoglucomutase-like phosphatase (HAD superfamily)
VPDAVIFDLDGVLVDSERLWNVAKEAVTRDAGGRWREEAQREMMGMSAPEWSRYMRDELRVPLEPPEIDRRVIVRLREL